MYCRTFHFLYRNVWGHVSKKETAWSGQRDFVMQVYDPAEYNVWQQLCFGFVYKGENEKNCYTRHYQ